MTTKEFIFVYGSPGSGKTTITKGLVEQNPTLELIEADAIRDKINPNPNIKFLELGTTEAYKEFGTLLPKNVILGLKAVRQAMLPYLLDMIKRLKPGKYVIEAAFLDPITLKKFGTPIFIESPTLLGHAKQFFAHRKLNLKHFKSFIAARMVQRYLRQEARVNDIAVVSNDKRLGDGK